MKNSPLLLIIISLALSPLAGAAEKKVATELEGLDHLISATEHTLSTGKRVRNHVKEYLKLQKAYLENPEDRDSCYLMVRAAHDVLEEVEQARLKQAFDAEFLAELSLFAEMGKKRGVPRP
jgi:hypothetical protein